MSNKINCFCCNLYFDEAKLTKNLLCPICNAIMMTTEIPLKSSNVPYKGHYVYSPKSDGKSQKK
jgi:hypothetical protein